MKTVLAVDPGAEHVGMAVWFGDKMKAREYAAEEWLPVFSILADAYDVIVIEDFVLYPSKAKAQSWSPMATSEMIGAMKWIARQACVEVVMQGANIKIPTRAQCKARHLQWQHSSGHASDALLHLWYYLLRNNIETEV